MKQSVSETEVGVSETEIGAFKKMQKHVYKYSHHQLQYLLEYYIRVKTCTDPCGPKWSKMQQVLQLMMTILESKLAQTHVALSGPRGSKYCSWWCLCLQIKKSHLMPPSRHDHFHLILILPVKIVKLPQQHANTTVHCL